MSVMWIVVATVDHTKLLMVFPCKFLWKNVHGNVDKIFKSCYNLHLFPQSGRHTLYTWGGGVFKSSLTLIKAPPPPLVQDCNVLIICNKQYIDNKSVSPEFGNVVCIYTGSWERFNFKFNFNQYFKLC